MRPRRPKEWALLAGMPAIGTWYARGDLKACVALEAGLWHMSISHPRRYPSWDEITNAWYRLVPDAENIEGSMLLPRAADYVNLHQNCFHVWQLKKGVAL
jgi:hypothetical protein